jgi:hypothetical protein
MFVGVAPFGNVDGWDWAWLALAFVGDVLSITTGGWSNRQRLGYA